MKFEDLKVGMIIENEFGVISEVKYIYKDSIHAKVDYEPSYILYTYTKDQINTFKCKSLDFDNDMKDLLV